jgi:glycosyltransferase involved in cell wall biosynthesis
VERILVVTNCLTGGGAERSMNLLVNELHSRGLEVALMPINISEEDLVKPICPIYPLGRTWQGGLIDFVKSYIRFVRVVNNWNPNVIILNCDLPELFGALNIKHIHRIIVVEHAQQPFASRVNLGKIVRKILCKRGSEFVAVSKHLEIWNVPRKPEAVLLNAIEFQKQNLNESYSSGPVVLKNIFFVGRLATIPKRPEIMLDISAQIKNKVIMIGDGEAKKRLQERIIRESLNVEMLGYVKSPWEFMNQGDVLVVPSLFEGDGMVIIEAISHDLPLLLSDIPDFRRFNFPEHNYCAAPEDFLKRIIDFRSKVNDLRVPELSRNEILQTRTAESVGDSWVSYLSSGK